MEIAMAVGLACAAIVVLSVLAVVWLSRPPIVFLKGADLDFTGSQTVLQLLRGGAAESEGGDTPTQDLLKEWGVPHIITREVTVETVEQVMRECIRDGARRFCGELDSQMLSAIIPLLEERPDVYVFSGTSTLPRSASFHLPRNAVRLLPNDVQFSAQVVSHIRDYTTAERIVIVRDGGSGDNVWVDGMVALIEEAASPIADAGDAEGGTDGETVEGRSFSVTVSEGAEFPASQDTGAAYVYIGNLGNFSVPEGPEGSSGYYSGATILVIGGNAGMPPASDAQRAARDRNRVQGVDPQGPVADVGIARARAGNTASPYLASTISSVRFAALSLRYPSGEAFTEAYSVRGMADLSMLNDFASRRVLVRALHTPCENCFIEDLIELIVDFVEETIIEPINVCHESGMRCARELHHRDRGFVGCYNTIVEGHCPNKIADGHDCYQHLQSCIDGNGCDYNGVFWSCISVLDGMGSFLSFF